jgi:murein DD-endopeptidase MepM/ murein hydrolase activator NlpD
VCLRIGFLAAVGLAALVPAAPAQAPARAVADARVASGDLGLAGRAAVQGDGREAIEDGAARRGMEIAAGSARASASRNGGQGRSLATATARGVSLFDGLVTAERVRRTAAAQDGAVTYRGSVTGLTLAGEGLAVDAAATHRGGGARVTVNTGGAGLRVRLLRPVAGFASGTEVVVALVQAEATDALDHAVTPEPVAPAPTPAEPLAVPPTSEPDPAPLRRKRSAAQRLARGRFVFPVYGAARCADDFGGPRQKGPHQGNDCFGAFGSPVLAVADGTLNRVGTLPISGNRLWLETDRGDSFFYAHLAAFAPGAVSGRRVKAGTLLGFLGNTGNAEPTPPHVHFEIHPAGARDDDGDGDGNAIDPHPVLTAWRENGDVPTGGWLARYGADTEPRPGALVARHDFIAEG